MISRVAAVVAALTAATACSGGTTSEDAETPDATEVPAASAAPYSGYESTQYSDGMNWLCHPEADTDYCDIDLDATVVNADGSTTVEEHEAAEDPPVDCFYVYPTVSFDEAGNSDFNVDDEETFVIANQAARYNSVCRVFAPVYRQTTVPNLLGVLPEGTPPGDSELAQADVVDAWKHYMANDNDGRGVILVGHSQGSGRLESLIRNEIVGDPALEDQIVSAHLIGTGPSVPEGSDTPDGFGGFSVCDEADETGCFVSYASFRPGGPPDAAIGAPDPGQESVCVNPADLGGGPATSTPYFPADSIGSLTEALEEARGPYDDPDRLDEIATPFYTLPDFVELACVQEGARNYLEVTVLADRGDPRTDDISGEISILPSFGLHLVDVSLAMGDLVDLAGTQTEAYLAR